MRALFIPIMIILVSGLPATEQLGGASWQASPTQPIGFAGQGCNWFPGATPPLQWQEKPSETSKGIAWKVLTPGGTFAQPLAVGDVVIGVYSPHHVVCYDAKTGKVRWKDELKFAHLPVLDKDLKPQLPKGNLEAEQNLFERMVAYNRVKFSVHGHKGHRPGAEDERNRLREHMLEMMKQWQQEYAKTLPGAAKALQASIDLFRTSPPDGFKESKPWVQESEKLLRWYHARMKPSFGASSHWRIDNNWEGSVSDVMATPVSDGAIVGVTFGYGQVAAYNIESGKRLWAWRHPLMNPGSVSHCGSPLLWKGLLLIPSPAATGARATQTSMLAVDKMTGEVKWQQVDRGTDKQNAWGMPSSHGRHQSPFLFHIQDDGERRAILVSVEGQMLDPVTGESFGFAPNRPSNSNLSDKIPSVWGEGFAAQSGNLLLLTSMTDKGGRPVMALRYALDEKQRPVWLEGKGFDFSKDAKSGRFPFAASDKYVIAKYTINDAKTGTQLQDTLDRKNFGLLPFTNTIVGDYLFMTRQTDRKNTTEAPAGLLTLTTRVLDLRTMPAKPVAANTIIAEGYTPDIAYKHFPLFASDPSLRRLAARVPGHCNYQGITHNWSIGIAGLTAKGSHLFVHSPAYLYCIGK